MLDVSAGVDAGGHLAGTGGPLGPDTVEYEARRLSIFYGHLPAEDMLKNLVRGELRGRIALVSSFGTEAAVLLHLISRVDPETPVVFLDTGKLFDETLAYRDRLVERLGLRDVRSVRPDPASLRSNDPNGDLWQGNADRCCYVRKVEPLSRALQGFDAWISGRKSFQSATRMGLPMIEIEDGRIKVNPLASWRKPDLDAYFAAHGLPRHPLEADGFLSIGCMPCTDRWHQAKIREPDGGGAARKRNAASITGRRISPRLRLPKQSSKRVVPSSTGGFSRRQFSCLHLGVRDKGPAVPPWTRGSRPRSVIRAVTSRAGVTSNA